MKVLKMFLYSSIVGIKEFPLQYMSSFHCNTDDIAFPYVPDQGWIQDFGKGDSETKLFHFHRMFKNGGGGWGGGSLGVRANPP